MKLVEVTKGKLQGKEGQKLSPRAVDFQEVGESLRKGK